ncbi:hypothetical protein VNO77_03808 [Canavalia gladiata]|uniref:Uncharacterized protein n=1 Tax=Canavalia gladiata TaxID=3824 RepID=A0AAN9R494_CANGL
MRAMGEEAVSSSMQYLHTLLFPLNTNDMQLWVTRISQEYGLVLLNFKKGYTLKYLAIIHRVACNRIHVVITDAASPELLRKENIGKFMIKTGAQFRVRLSILQMRWAILCPTFPLFNGMERLSQLGHVVSLGHARSFTLNWAT